MVLADLNRTTPFSITTKLLNDEPFECHGKLFQLNKSLYRFELRAGLAKRFTERIFPTIAMKDLLNDKCVITQVAAFQRRVLRLVPSICMIVVF